MDEFVTRAMPHSSEAEQAVLGSMLIDSRCVGDVLGAVSAGDFYSQINREIFETIYTMFNYSMTIDPLTVLEQMRVSGVIRDDSSAYLLELMNITPTAANVLEYAAIVKNTALLRAIADTGSTISAMALEGEGGADAILEAAERRIYALRQGKNTSGLEPLSQVMVRVYDQITTAAKSDASIPGISTGFLDIDRAIMGLNRSDLILIASRPGMGKTSIALNIALYAAKNSGKTVAVFSLEMSREQLGLRLLSGESFVDGKKLQRGNLSQNDWHNVIAAVKSLSEASLLINDNPTLTVADMNAQCRRISNLGLVVIDYLQLMTSATGTSNYAGENRTQVVSDISRMLKIMAKELNVPVLCLSQLSRANEGRTNKRPMLSDLRESGAIEQDADIVIGLYRDDYYNKETEEPNVAECIVLKNRRGETDTVKLRWLPEYTTYTTMVDPDHTEKDM